MFIFLMLPPSCSEENQVELVGVLYGFQKNSTFWDVVLGNVTYHFGYFDKSYLEKMLGHNITITACDAGRHYDYLSAYINKNGE